MKRRKYVAIKNWSKNGVGMTTVWTRRRRKLYATTTWHKYERADDGTIRYLPSSTEDAPVSALGMWREGSFVEGWNG